MDFKGEEVCLCFLFVDFGKEAEFQQRYDDVEDFCLKIVTESDTYPVPGDFYLGGERRFTVCKEGYIPALDLYQYTERDYTVGTIGFVAKQRDVAEKLCTEFKTCYNYKHTCLILDIEVDDLCTFD